mgnify:FL=1
MKRWLKRSLVVLAILVPILLLAPLTAAAISNSEVITILNASIDGLIKLVRLAYCASGVGALC